jgi:hypothetical protein
MGVAERLTAHWEQTGYGRVQINHAAGEVVVFWKGSPLAGIQSMLGRQPNGVLVALQPTQFSASELEAAGRTLMLMVRRQVPIATVAPNNDLSGLRVEILRTWTGQASTLETVAGVPVTVEPVDEGPVLTR